MTTYIYMSPESLLEKARELTALAHRVIHMQKDKKHPEAHAYITIGRDAFRGTNIKIRIGEDQK